MMNVKNIKNWPLIRPCIGVVFSRKFLVVLIAAVASYGLDLTPEMKGLILLAGAGIIAVTNAWEDAAAKGAGNPPAPPE